MKIQIPAEVLKIYDTFEKNSYEVYFVGGTVRDMLLNRPIKDYDLTTNATPEQILELFPSAFYDNNFGTVGITIKNNDQTEHVVEVTTYRSESEYKDRRHPEKIEWGKTIEEDLKRRDFTINAIAMKFNGDEIEFVDPFHGRKDLEQKIIKAVGNPNERFKEDALR